VEFAGIKGCFLYNESARWEKDSKSVNDAGPKIMKCVTLLVCLIVSGLISADEKVVFDCDFTDSFMVAARPAMRENESR